MSEKSFIDAFRNPVWLTLLLLIAFVSALTLNFATPHGLAISWDSTRYLAASRSIMAGNGPVVLGWSGQPEFLVHYPPMYPAILAVLGKVFGDPQHGGRILNLFLVALNIILGAAIAANVAGGARETRRYAALVTAIAMCVATDLIKAAAFLWSETLFITLSLATLLYMARLLSTDDSQSVPRWRILAIIVLLTGTAALVRYAGLSLIAACTISTLLFSLAPLQRRAARAAAYLTLALAPLAGWFFYSRVITGELTNRVIVWHRPYVDDIQLAVFTMAEWLAPERSSVAVRLAALGCIAVILACAVAGMRQLKWNLAHSSGPEGSNLRSMRMTQVVTVNLIVYGIFLIATISFVDKDVPLDTRLLAPALSQVIPLVVGLLALLLHAGRQGRAITSKVGVIRMVALSFLVLYMVSQGTNLLNYARDVRQNGLGFARIHRGASELMVEVGKLPPAARVYSDYPYLIAFATGRVVPGLPLTGSSQTLLPNARFDAEMKEIVEQSSITPAHLVFFDLQAGNPFVSKPSNVDVVANVTSVRRLKGGVIVSIDGPRKSEAQDASAPE